MMDGPNNGIVLYHYSFSPFARRVLWYLSLRGIDYAECVRSLPFFQSLLAQKVIDQF